MDHVPFDGSPVVASLRAGGGASAEAHSLEGERVAFLGRLSGMTRREAVDVVRQRGGSVVEMADHPTLVVRGDEHASAQSAGASEVHRVIGPRQGVSEPPPQEIVEAQFWQQLGFVGDWEVRRYYTPAMLADLLGVPTQWIRRWTSRGLLQPTHRIHRLAYFSFEEAGVARHLAQLHQAGCTLRSIERHLSALRRRFPEIERPLADPQVVVEGRRLLLRRDEDLSEPHGQLLLDFDQPDDDEFSPFVSLTSNSAPGSSPGCGEPASSQESLRDGLMREAAAWEEEGEYRRAAEAYRSLLACGDRSADVQFALAESLYRCGDLGAARERFYVALEIDEEFVEARASLGCVLAETGEAELAAATFQGALRYHPDFADVHFHLAQTYEQLGDRRQAAEFFRSFLTLAPESPWASAARERLAADDRLKIVSSDEPLHESRP